MKLDTLAEIVHVYGEALEDPAAREVLLVLDEALERLGYDPWVRRALFGATLDRCRAALPGAAPPRLAAARAPEARPSPYRDLPPGGLRSLPVQPGIKRRGLGGRRVA